LKNALIWLSSMSKSDWWYLFHKEVEKNETLQHGLKFDNFKPRLKSGIFIWISWLNGSFLGDDWVFLKEEVKTYLMTPMSPLNSLTFFCLHSSHLYSMTHPHTPMFTFPGGRESKPRKISSLVLVSPHPAREWHDIRRMLCRAEFLNQISPVGLVMIRACSAGGMSTICTREGSELCDWSLTVSRGPHVVGELLSLSFVLLNQIWRAWSVLLLGNPSYPN
jgi:hypothetical protein